MGTDDRTTVSLGYLCEGIYDGPHATPKKTSHGPIFLGISNLSHGRLDLTEVEHLSEEDFIKWTHRVTPKAGDIVFSYETRLGEAVLIPDRLRCCLGRRMGLLRVNHKKADPRFLLYAYLAPEFQDIIRARTIHGSTVDRIPLIDLPDFPITIPPLPEQRVIAHILGTLDDKIELNHQMNKTLEEIGKTIFKHWLIDFEFPNEKGKPYKSSGGEMTYNEELGKDMPKDWLVKPLDEVADFSNGLAMQKYPAESENEFLPVIKIKELREGVTDSSDKASPNIPEAYVVVNGDVLFSWSGSLEVVIWTSGRGALNQHLFKVTSKDYPKWFYYYWLLQHLPEYRRIAEGKATTMGHIQRHHLKSSLVFVPDRTVLQTMDKILSPVVEKIIGVNIQSRNLSQMRDLLLPRLMSGKMRVPVEAR